MTGKIISLQGMLVDKITIAAIEQGCQKYKSTFYAEEVKARLDFFASFTAQTTKKIDDYRLNIKTILALYGDDEPSINNFLKALTLAKIADVANFVAKKLYPHISSNNPDKVILGNSIIQLNLHFNHEHMIRNISYSYAKSVSLDVLDRPDSSNWADYVANRIIATNKEVHSAQQTK